MVIRKKKTQNYKILPPKPNKTNIKGKKSECISGKLKKMAISATNFDMYQPETRE